MGVGAIWRVRMVGTCTPYSVGRWLRTTRSTRLVGFKAQGFCDQLDNYALLSSEMTRESRRYSSVILKDRLPIYGVQYGVLCLFNQELWYNMYPRRAALLLSRPSLRARPIGRARGPWRRWGSALPCRGELSASTAAFQWSLDGQVYYY